MSTNFHFLVVDDFSTMRRIVINLLKELGYHKVSEAEDGEKGLKLLQTPDLATPINFVVSDWNMPVMDGLTFLKSLRAEFGHDNPPVVFCTTENDMDHIEAAIANGAQEYIMKPFDEDILTSKFAQVGLL
jgi:two-component system, chemotaxis family, chemotaxis protein CheY